jgi:hypothetical protein
MTKKMRSAVYRLRDLIGSMDLYETRSVIDLMTDWIEGGGLVHLDQFQAKS